ncbi:hypothetical protein LTR09_012633 [Extremus antarcticus]|uniref:Heterokaryon incompatibility domain-containing protein n=1 Tax=Extremus antarcticus TaxID=702011 RepID=A0AAJ0G494_9PEZI|nr:hypothetical protein LTR09_012633 [Extremus antarcticus]
MWRIFAGAEQVIGWLGPTFQGSDEALADIIVFAGAPDEASREQIAQVMLCCFGEHFTLDAVLSYIGGVMLLGSDRRSRMLRLFSLPWFRRRWIAQEACLASNLRIYCGLSSISGMQLFRAISLIQAIIVHGVSPWLQRPFRNAFALLRTREMVQGAVKDGCHVSLAQITQTLSFLDCKEDQDRINALFGVVRSSNSWFTPEYCATQDLYNKFALSHMQHLQSFEILHFAGLTEPIRHKSEKEALQSNLVAFHISIEFKPEENPQYQHSVDPWCNNMFVNFLAEIVSPWATQYRVSKSFTHWFDAVVGAGEDPTGPLLRFARTLVMDGRIKSDERPDRTVPQDKIFEYFLEYAKLHLVADQVAASLAFAAMADDYISMEKAAAYGYLAEHICRYRTLFIGDGDVVGLGSPGICPGDRVCFFSGLKTPFVVHPEGGHFKLRGECYLDGFMDSTFDELEAVKLNIVLK